MQTASTLTLGSVYQVQYCQSKGKKNVFVGNVVFGSQHKRREFPVRLRHAAFLFVDVLFEWRCHSKQK